MQGKRWLRALFLVLTGLFASLTLSQCGVKQPKVDNPNYSSPASNHARYKIACSECHEYARGVATQDIDAKTRLAITVPHGFGRDCVGCHAYNPTTPWVALTYSHSPSPPSCLGCHSIQRKANPHEARGECASCHTYPDWTKIGAATTGG